MPNGFNKEPGDFDAVACGERAMSPLRYTLSQMRPADFSQGAAREPIG